MIDSLILPWSAASADSSEGGTVQNALIEPRAQSLNAAGTKPTQLGRANDAGCRPLFFPNIPKGIPYLASLSLN